jgi:hypothetical protein
MVLPDGAEALLTPLAEGWLLRPVEACAAIAVEPRAVPAQPPT